MKHQPKRRSRRFDFRFPFIVALPVERHACRCGRSFASREGLTRHINLYRWEDPTQGEIR